MSLHDELLRSARSILLRNVSATDRLIRNLYIRAARSLAGKISSAKKGSLTERWLIAYKRELDLEIARMNADIERAIVAGARNAARARAEAEAEWLRAVAARAEVDDSFVSVLANVPTDALRAMYDGKLYTDGRMLSRRIWDATGRLEGNIAEIIQQGVAQKMDALTLARSLEAYVNPKAACPVSWHKLYPDIPFDRKVDYSALRLARTSISHVYWAADKAAAKKNPLCTGLKWHLSDSHYERQVAVAGEDVCDAYARHDEGLGTGVYPVDLIPFPHPQCLCYRTEVLPTLEESAEMLGKWVRGEAASPEMDASFEKWKRENAEELENWKGFSNLSDVKSREMAGGGRRGKNHILTEEEIYEIQQAILDIGADPNAFMFLKQGATTGYIDAYDMIVISGNVIPDLTSNHPRDRMSIRAALAHEYFGHRAFRNTRAAKDSWNDEFRASYTAAIHAPGLNAEERQDLMLDALERAKEAGVNIKFNSEIRRILYGYEVDP